MGPHFADKNGDHKPLCGSAGSVVYNVKKVNCDECLTLLRKQRQQRIQQKQAQAEVTAILKKRKAKQDERIRRLTERKTSAHHQSARASR